MEAKVERRDFLKKVPLFGAGLALSLIPLAAVGETPQMGKLSENYFAASCSPTGVTNCNPGVNGSCGPGTINCGTGA